MDIVVRGSILTEAEFEEGLDWEDMKMDKSYQRKSSTMESQMLW